jgi:hypothetical protein
MKPILGNDEGSAVRSPRDVRAACTAAGLMCALAQCLLKSLRDEPLSTPALTSVGAQMRHFGSFLCRGRPAAGELFPMRNTAIKIHLHVLCKDSVGVCELQPYLEKRPQAFVVLPLLGVRGEVLAD